MRGVAVHALRGRGIVLRGNDIDTDRIIPARYLASITFVGLEEGLFRDARFSADGQPKDHAFNERRFHGASLLVTGRNFGCGSSREHAPQALMRWGIRAIVAESFAEIFFGNWTAIGLPAVTAAPGDVATLMDSIELDPQQELALDLEAMTLGSRAGTISVSMPAGARRQLLDGSWNALEMLLSGEDEIRTTLERLPYLRDFRPAE